MKSVEAMLMEVDVGKAVFNSVVVLLTTLVLLAIISNATLVGAQDESPNSGVIRHSPDVITKILPSNLSLQQLSKLLNSTNVDSLLGDEGLGNGILNTTSVVNSLAENPEAAAQLTSNDVAKLSKLTTQSAGTMPSNLRIDLSLLASLAKDPTLRDVLKDWASAGNINLNELKSKVNINSLSPEDLAILKSALGLAAKYGLINPNDVKELGLSDLTPEDLRAIANIAERLAKLSKDPRAADLLKELARKSTELSLSGNLTPGSLTGLLSGLENNASLPYVIKSITDGLKELAQTSGSGATPSIPEIPKLNIPNVQTPMLTTRVNTANIFSFLRIILASIIGMLIMYLLYRLLKKKVQYAMLSMRKGKAVPQVKGLGGINAAVIQAYWDAVAWLSILVPLNPSETHREYLRRVRKVAGAAFEQLTRIYEIARWSGRKLDERYAVTASRLVEVVRNAVRKGAGGESH